MQRVAAKTLVLETLRHGIVAITSRRPIEKQIGKEIESRDKEYLWVEIADVGGGVLVPLGGVLPQKVRSHSRSDPSRHLAAINLLALTPTLPL